MYIFICTIETDHIIITREKCQNISKEMFKYVHIYRIVHRISQKHSNLKKNKNV